MAEAGEIVRPIRIHQRIDIGQRIATLMMVDHDHRHAQTSGFGSGSRLVVPQSTATSRVAPFSASMRTASALGP